ncbi:MAG: 4Fe-4S binding protein [Deltaproteobacteria bacterium]|nr:4Fe-4S binding protein [Deltaproteobacteria bacterium]
MDNRRTFLKKGSLALLALSSSASVFPVRLCAKTEMTVTDPKTAAVIWYSQTGNSERTGRLIAETFNKKGLNVTASDYRDFDPRSIGTYDLIVAGSPVYYYDVPENFKRWLKSLPEITGKPCASYVTFGGTGGNQHNTVCSLAGLLAEKGGVPVGMETFGNMSTFAITWSYGNDARVLEYKHLPDDISYDRMRTYARLILDRVHEGQGMEIEKDCDFRDLIKNSPSIWGTKLFISHHSIDGSKCIQCGTCLKKCPVGAIDLESNHVNTDACIACLGCVNNCPAGAVHMEFMGKNVYGYHDFLKENHIQIHLPEELRKVI